MRQKNLLSPFQGISVFFAYPFPVISKSSKSSHFSPFSLAVWPLFSDDPPKPCPKRFLCASWSSVAVDPAAFPTSGTAGGTRGRGTKGGTMGAIQIRFNMGRCCNDTLGWGDSTMGHHPPIWPHWCSVEALGTYFKRTLAARCAMRCAPA